MQNVGWPDPSSPHTGASGERSMVWGDGKSVLSKLPSTESETWDPLVEKEAV